MGLAPLLQPDEEPSRFRSVGARHALSIVDRPAPLPRHTRQQAVRLMPCRTRGPLPPFPESLRRPRVVVDRAAAVAQARRTRDRVGDVLFRRGHSFRQ